MSTYNLVVALCLWLPLLANGSSKECKTSVEGYTWEYDENIDDLIIGVDTVDLCYKTCADDTECQGYTWTNAGVVQLCYTFKHQLQGYHECVACSSGVLPQSLDGACVGEYNDILDVGPADSVAECRQFCAVKYGCEAYTWWDSTSSFINTCFLYRDCMQQSTCNGCVSGKINCINTPPDQCVDYMILDDDYRNVHTNGVGPLNCDNFDTDYVSSDWQGPGYYRIMSSAGSRLPESVPGQSHCKTEAPGWLRGEHPQDMYAEKMMTVCFVYFADCYKQVNVTVTNCSGFYVYMLPDTPFCFSRYCITN